MKGVQTMSRRAPPQKKLKRCYFFRPDGQPRPEYSGCRRDSQSCRFVHPDEPEWDDAPDSRPPQHLDRINTSHLERNPPINTSPGFLPSSSPREYKTMYRRSRSRSPTSSTSLQAHHGNSRHSISSFHGFDHSRRFSGDGRSPASIDTGADERSRNQHLPPSSSRKAGLSQQQPPTPTVVSQPPPPPPPTHSEPQMPPPPPLPVAPEFLTSKPTPVPPEPSAEEKRGTWVARIKIINENALIHAQREKIEKDLQSIRHIINSSGYSSFNEVQRKATQAQLAKLESELVEKQKSLDENLQRLVESASWPVSPPPEGDIKAEEQRLHMLKYVVELKETAEEMNRVLNEIREPKGPAREGLDTPMEQGSSRPLKRRRVDDDSGNSQDALTGTHPSIEELEKTRDKILTLEGRLSNFENDMHAHDAEFRDELDERFENKFEQLYVSRRPAEPSEDHLEKLQLVEDNIIVTGEQVGEVADEMGNLMIRMSKLEDVLADLQRENAQFREDLPAMQQQLQVLIAPYQQEQRKTTALSAALAAYMARPPSPPASPRTISLDYILNCIEEPINEILRTQTKPLVENLRSDIADLLHAQNAEMYETLWGKFTLTLRMVEALSAQLKQKA